MRKKELERAQARELRMAGRSLREIARTLNVALSSVSVWVRDIPRPVDEALQPVVDPPPPVEVGERRCSRCQAIRPLSEFNRHPSGHQWYCRACFRSYYEEGREHHRSRNNELKIKRVAAARRLVLAHLAAESCTDCGENDAVVLEFDHVAEKRTEISAMVSRGVREEVLQKELARCEVVCVNCHRRRTARRGGWRRLDLGGGREWRSKAQERNVLEAWCILLARGCVDCHCRDLVVLDFDHVGPKTASVMALAHREVSLRRLHEEIENCVVRCANCHRRRTATGAGYYRTSTAEYPHGDSNSDYEVENLAC